MLPPWAPGVMRREHLPAGRGDADRAVHRVERQLHLRAAAARPEQAGAALPVDLVDPDDLLERVVQHRRAVRRGQRPEVGERGRHRPVAGRGDLDQVHGEGVAGLGALDARSAR